MAVLRTLCKVAVDQFRNDKEIYHEEEFGTDVYPDLPEGVKVKVIIELIKDEPIYVGKLQEELITA